MATKNGLLAQSAFPLYAVQALGSSHFIVAGGGGQAKTGIPNAVVCKILFISKRPISRIKIGKKLRNFNFKIKYLNSSTGTHIQG